MLTNAGTILRICRQVASHRSFTITPTTYAAAAKASDPIQALFVEKVRAYANKSQASGGKLVDATPEVEARFKAEVERVEKTFGAVAGQDFTKFPVFNFKDTNLEAVGVSVEAKDVASEAIMEDEAVADTAFFDA